MGNHSSMFKEKILSSQELLEGHKDKCIIPKPSYTPLPFPHIRKQEGERDEASPSPKQFCTWNGEMVGWKGKACRKLP